MPEHVVRLRPPAMPSRAFLFRQGMISNIANIYGFCLSRSREKGGEAVKHRIWSLASTAAGPKRGRKSIRLCKNEILYTSFLAAIIPRVLHLSFFFLLASWLVPDRSLNKSALRHKGIEPDWRKNLDRGKFTCGKTVTDREERGQISTSESRQN